VIIKQIESKLNPGLINSEAESLNKIICLDHERVNSPCFKSVVILNNFLIDQNNLEKLELMIHQMKVEAEGILGELRR
jgi:hypothetical protein